MRIIYVGPLYDGGTCLQRMNALKGAGNEILPVDTEPRAVQDKQSNFVYRVKRKLFGPTDLAGANNSICKLLKEYPADILWLDKALTIKRETLEIVREISIKTIIIGYAPDDMAGKHNQSHTFLKALPLYHVYFTTKSFGVKELEVLGVKKAVFVGNGYDPSVHRRMDLSIKEKEQYGAPVGFIGDYENERAQSMSYLAQCGISVRIWGQNWNKIKRKLTHSNMKIEGKSLWGEEYTKALCSFDINLGFLRKINRDLQTQRSVEIPACGGFMLMERTLEHLALFEEGREAEYFSSKEELLEKVKYYLSHEDERKSIAQAGRERCLKSGYSNLNRISFMLKIIEELNEND
jgi:hypothetical protein